MDTERIISASEASSLAPQVKKESWFQMLKTKIININFKQHLILSIVLRLLLIYYGQLQDANSEVQYTDIDYKVVTDGARHVLNGETPFARHTYRYSPLLAWLQLPNVLLHPATGKLFYCSFDILCAVLIYSFVYAELRCQCRKAVLSLLNKFGKHETVFSKSKAKQQQQDLENDARNRPEKVARASACFWLYNPLTAVISTRGNGDSFSSFFVIASIYLLCKADELASTRTRRPYQYWLIFAAGLAHGFAIHLRLYPLLFSLAYYMCLSDCLTNSFRRLLRLLLLPSSRQIVLVLGTLVGLFGVSGLFYYLYGWQYVYEAYLYHFVRKDARHNFSLYFLYQYLSSDDASSVGGLEKALLLAPQLMLLLYLTISFGQFRQTLPFCIFALAFTLVTFNTVVTSQYFIWYLSLLPLCLNNLQSIPLPKAVLLFTVWLLAQALWIIPAYFLEFKTWHTFYWIGAQSALFFIVNNVILTYLIQNYSFTSFKVNFKKLF